MPLLFRGDPFDRAHRVKADMKRRASFAPVLNGEGREIASLDALTVVGAGVAAIWATNPWIAAWRACWFWMRACRMFWSMVGSEVDAGKTIRGSWGAIGLYSIFGVVAGGRGCTGSEIGVGGTSVGAVETSDQCGVAGKAR